jgi:phage baseplate assembly protein W
VPLGPVATEELGTDLAGSIGLDAAFTLVGGHRALAEACIRRLTTPRGGLFYAPNYGTDVREMLAARFDAARLSGWKARIEAELRKDDRVLAAAVDLTPNAQTESVAIRIRVTTAEGPFSFTLAASALSVELLTVG